MARKQSGSRQVTNEILSSYPAPTPTQRFARIISARGSNLFEIEYYDEPTQAISKAMCRMPQKFRTRVWVKAGDFLIVEPDGDKSDGVMVLYPDHIKYLQSLKLWPPPFEIVKRQEQTSQAVSATVDVSPLEGETEEEGDEGQQNDSDRRDSGEEESEDEDDLVPNPNHY